MNAAPFTRRTFIKSAALVAGGGLMLAFGEQGADAAAAPSGAGAHADPLSLHYLRVGADGAVVVISPVAEVGQGTSTALAMVVADALDADWNQVRYELAPVAPAFANPILKSQLTGASTGVSAWHDLYAKAGATARAMLVGAAAQDWKVAPSECTTDNGRVLHPASGRSLGYGELARRAAAQPVPAGAQAAPRGKGRLERTAVARLDVPAKVDGTAQYAIDVRLPGMLYAAVTASPAFGGARKSDARAALRKLPGIEGVVDLPGAVAVVARRWWTARHALDALAVEWSPGPAAKVGSDTISAQLWRDLDAGEGALVRATGKPAEHLAGAGVVTARYEVPFLAHATMEPMSCVARVGHGRCDIWIGSQRPDRARLAAAKLLGMPEAAVTIHPVLAGGGFGRRQEADVAEQAVAIARAFPGRPVKLVWSREEDIQHDFYRPAGVSEMSAAIQGKEVIALRHRQATPAILPHTFPQYMGKFDSVASDNIFSLYAFPHQDAYWVRSETPVPTGMWRSVGASHTVFAIESFVDELAAKTGVDAYRFRRQLLLHDARALAVLDRLAVLSGWNDQRHPGRAIGLAISHKNLDCLVAQSAEVSVKDGQVTVHRICTVADPGRIVNPDTVRSQLEGAAVWGLSAALFGKISIAEGRVQQSNFHDYRVVRLAETPTFATEIVESGGAFEGVGEGGAPGVAPAVCNAIFRLTGKRIRTLPIGEQLA